MGRKFIASLIASIAGVAALWLPVAANAGTVTVQGPTLVFTGSSGETNNLKITQAPNGLFQIADSGATVTPSGPACFGGFLSVQCRSQAITAIQVSLSDRNDTFELASNTPLSLDGGEGDDTVDGGAGPDRIRGGDGNDTLRGGPGGDSLSGDAGDDRLDGQTGPDSQAGGPGRDIAQYFRTNPVFVALDSVAADGETKERDNVANDIEVIAGGSANDRLEGGPGNETLIGNQGDDILNGLGGDDDLQGQAGNDALSGGDGNDKLIGNSDNDRLNGDGGDDSLDGGPGNDTANGGVGRDAYLPGFPRTTGVTIILDGAANDGSVGEADNVLLDIETVFGTPFDDTLIGGQGPDGIVGQGGNDLINGEAGDDRLFGTDGNDTLIGGEGRDELSGGDGADNLSGGAGIDLANYFVFAGEDPRALLTVTIDGLANDGATGEGDNVQLDVEDVRAAGTPSNLTGSGGANALSGSPGDDSLDGGVGVDVLSAGGGNDVIRARDGFADGISCGPGDDIVLADPQDSVGTDCENVLRTAADLATLSPGQRQRLGG
jgi:Ca2+-binding RTX toxin-like protein